MVDQQCIGFFVVVVFKVQVFVVPGVSRSRGNDSLGGSHVLLQIFESKVAGQVSLRVVIGQARACSSGCALCWCHLSLDTAQELYHLFAFLLLCS